MTAINLYHRLKSLQPEQPVLTGQITSGLSDGTVLVHADSGGDFVARNPLDIAVGQSVYFQNGVITGPGPDLTYVFIAV